MEQYNEILKQHERQHAAGLLKKHGLICKQLAYGNNCAPLYLGKPHWTNRFDPDRESTVGIFCAIWISPSLLKKKLFAYNIHSKTLRKLPGYKLNPAKFASEFRSLVELQVSSWPNIRLDYGPSTLLEGRDSSELSSFAAKVEDRILGFVEIYQQIDDMLEMAKE